MYLEISQRQSGKTERMIQHIFRNNVGKTVKMRTPYNQMVHYVKMRLLELSEKNGGSFKCPKIECVESDKADYYDEFDFINFENIKNINYSGYFCTSPMYARETNEEDLENDVIFNCLKRNNFTYNHFKNLSKNASAYSLDNEKFLTIELWSKLYNI